MTARPTWRQIAATLDKARARPIDHQAEVARHLASFPRATLRTGSAPVRVEG